MNHYDTILLVQNPINEVDSRTIAKQSTQGGSKYFAGSVNYDDPRIHQANGFGRLLQTQLGSMGNEWAVEVTDFNKWVTVRVTHSNTTTGRSASKTYLIVFQPDKTGMVLSTANKYRTISGVDQAASYIRSSASALAQANSSKI